MDDIWGHLEAALWTYLGKAADFCLAALSAAGGKAVELAAVVAGWVVRFAAWLASVPLWISAPCAVLLIGLVACYLLRQSLYDRLLVYHDVRFTRRGYARRVFSVRRGAVHEVVEAMAREVALPGRFREVAVYEAVPGRYLVAYGPAGGMVEDLRAYRRDRRAGLSAMAGDLIRHFRVNARMLHPDGELRALFAVLDARDPDFAACRPALPGETEKKTARGVTRAVDVQA